MAKVKSLPISYLQKHLYNFREEAPSWKGMILMHSTQILEFFPPEISLYVSQKEAKRLVPTRTAQCRPAVLQSISPCVFFLDRSHNGFHFGTENKKRIQGNG